LAASALVPLSMLAQYPGQVAGKSSKNAPDLRAVAVLEWTGDISKPTSCRIVPVTVFDGDKLQDAGVYLARPQPLALSGEVEYELKQNGKTFGLFDVENAGQEQGTWVGYGKWKEIPAPKAPKETAPAKIDEEVADDKPVLHRKQHGEEPPDSGTKGGGTSTTSSQQPAGGDDPDRPKLEKKPEKKQASQKTSSPDSEGPAPATARPELAPSLGDVESVGSSDPDRPKLQRGKVNGTGVLILPSLMGIPADMQQAVAVSDAKNRPDHPWNYSWANPDDEKKMQAAMEDMARHALGLKTAAPEPAPAAKKPGAAAHKPVKAAEPPAVPLADEQFRVFELAYGSGATMVLTAHTDGPPASRKFVTIIAQPDLYGNVLVLLKSVTDMAHLDETPRMRLVDAVDALEDNRGELLFELRGEGSRQFVLYRIYRGRADKLFATGGGVYGTLSSE